MKRFALPLLMAFAGALVMTGCDDGDEEKKEETPVPAIEIPQVNFPSAPSGEQVDGLPQEPGG